MSGERSKPAGKQVLFMATCLCDALYADAAKAAVEVLEAAGCEVLFPEAQTCCSQPAFNSGDWEAARTVGRHVLQVFEGTLPVVVPSASCAAMLRHGLAEAFAGHPERAAAEALGARTWELAEFLVEGLGLKEWRGSYERRVAFHRSCHSRGSLAGESARVLLRSLRGLTLVEQGEQEQCCGFGGTFSVAFPQLSTAMGRQKLSELASVTPEELVGGDLSCLMHLGGLAEKAGTPVRYRHLAQVLRDSLGATAPVKGGRA